MNILMSKINGGSLQPKVAEALAVKGPAIEAGYWLDRAN